MIDLHACNPYNDEIRRITAQIRARFCIGSSTITSLSNEARNLYTRSLWTTRNISLGWSHWLEVWQRALLWDESVAVHEAAAQLALLVPYAKSQSIDLEPSPSTVHRAMTATLRPPHLRTQVRKMSKKHAMLHVSLDWKLTESDKKAMAYCRLTDDLRHPRIDVQIRCQKKDTLLSGQTVVLFPGVPKKITQVVSYVMLRNVIRVEAISHTGSVIGKNVVVR